MLSILIIGAAAAVQAPALPARPPGTTRTDLQRHDLSVRGWESLQALVTFAPGASFPRHKHPGEEIIYVTHGTIEYEVAGKPVTVKAGEVLFIPFGVSLTRRGIRAPRRRPRLRPMFSKKANRSWNSPSSGSVRSIL